MTGRRKLARSFKRTPLAYVFVPLDFKPHYRTLFETELSDWYNDPALWPKNLSLTLFHEWFDVECHSVVMDTVGSEIYDDE